MADNRSLPVDKTATRTDFWTAICGDDNVYSPEWDMVVPTVKETEILLERMEAFCIEHLFTVRLQQSVKDDFVRYKQQAGGETCIHCSVAKIVIQRSSTHEDACCGFAMAWLNAA